MSITSLSQSHNNQYYNQPTFKAAIPRVNVTACGNVVNTAKASGLKGLGSKIKGVYDSFVEKVIAKKIIAPIMNSRTIDKLADKTAKVENMTDHMATAGSIVTTATYAGTTLKNKNLEKKPARTLALNQVLVMILSTIGAYTINNGIANFTKKMSYKFSDVNQKLPNELLTKRVQGFKVAQKLLTFTLMYRYISPVIVTPVASKISKALTNNNNVETKTKKA